MARECFTCKNKISTELTKEQVQAVKDALRAEGKSTLWVSDMEFHCRVSGKKIRQIDSACAEYVGDKLMEELRKDIAITAIKLRKGL